jgi:hypothetical protein
MSKNKDDDSSSWLKPLLAQLSNGKVIATCTALESRAQGDSVRFARDAAALLLGAGANCYASNFVSTVLRGVEKWRAQKSGAARSTCGKQYARGCDKQKTERREKKKNFLQIFLTFFCEKGFLLSLPRLRS